MPWYKRLRWRLIASQFVVVMVGVGTMVLATLFILSQAPTIIQPYLANLAADPTLLDRTQQELLQIFGNAVLLSVLVAALLSLAAGIISAVVLWRTIIAPLNHVAYSSRRIADGRYSERVSVPTNSGEAMAQLVISFNQMAVALEQIEQQRLALLSNISHELRTPLTGLKGYLEGLLDGLFPANEETFAWMSQEIERLHRLVNDIQNLSRIEAGQIELHCQAFELGNVAQRTITTLQPQAQSKTIALTLAPTNTPIYAFADPDRVAQIMINLMGNAIRYTPDGGSILVSIEQDGREAQIVIQDTGVGIAAESLPYIFERFYRVDASRARHSGGTGIGLTIAQHLVWAMGGELTADSEGENKGSTFTFSLPMAQTDHEGETHHSLAKSKTA